MTNLCLNCHSKTKLDHLETHCSRLAFDYVVYFRSEKKPELYKKYNNFNNESINLGHIEEVPDNELVLPNYNCFYRPYHCVCKDSSTTAKLRVVFDASAKTTSVIPLNDKLRVGPTFQNDHFSILICFGMHQVALSADIVKIYRQVELEEEGRDFLSNRVEKSKFDRS